VLLVKVTDSFSLCFSFQLHHFPFSKDFTSCFLCRCFIVIVAVYIVSSQ
jgi:hypothetical protein